MPKSEETFETTAPKMLPALEPERTAIGAMRCDWCDAIEVCRARAHAGLLVKCETPVYQDVITSALLVEVPDKVFKRLDTLPDAEKKRVLAGYVCAVEGHAVLTDLTTDRDYLLGLKIGQRITKGLVQ
jgi:hypothetical protein